MASKKTRIDSTTGSRQSLRIVPKADGWQVERESSSRGVETYRTQADAVDSARERLRISGGELKIHGKDGRVREAVTLGRRAMSMISSVEGIALDREAIKDLRSYDKAGLSSEQRRERIAEKYAGAKSKR